MQNVYMYSYTTCVQVSEGGTAVSLATSDALCSGFDPEHSRFVEHVLTCVRSIRHATVGRILATAVASPSVGHGRARGRVLFDAGLASGRNPSPSIRREGCNPSTEVAQLGGLLQQLAE